MGDPFNPFSIIIWCPLLFADLLRFYSLIKSPH